MDAVKIDKIVRSNRNSMALVVDNQAKVIARVPSKATDTEIETFIKKYSAWIIDKKSKATEKLKSKTPREFITGEKFLYLGKYYPLLLVDNYKYSFNFNNTTFLLDSRYKQYGRKIFELWYKQQAQKVFPPRVEHFSNLTGIQYKNIGVTNAKKRWGSCSSVGNINFAWRLLLAPPSVIDYVIIHELVHVLHPDHSKAFWLRVKKFCPNYKSELKWLRENGYLLDI